jgi:hypothetical protein
MCTAVPVIEEPLLYTKRQCLGKCTAVRAVESLLDTKRLCLGMCTAVPVIEPLL